MLCTKAAYQTSQRILCNPFPPYKSFLSSHTQTLLIRTARSTAGQIKTMWPPLLVLSIHTCFSFSKKVSTHFPDPKPEMFYRQISSGAVKFLIKPKCGVVWLK